MKILRPGSRAVALASAALMLAWLAGCATPDKPARATLYDFGPLVALEAAASPAQLPAIAFPEIEASGSLDSAAMLYRLGYADANQLRPYAAARWSAPPAQLVRQRLRQQLGRDRPVLDFAESAALARSGGLAPRVMRIDLEEFSQLFESPAQSSGLLRLRVTLLDNTAGGEKLLAQRNFAVQKPAPTADAAGGVRALTSAVDSAADEIARWLQQVR